MKRYKIIFATIFFVFFIAINVFATTIWLGTRSGNDPSNPSADLSDLESYLALKGYDVDLEFYGKVEFSKTTLTEESTLLSLTYDMDSGESRSGKWYTDDEISLFSVKTANGYALYWLDPAATSGSWDTSDLDDKGISHFSAWTAVTEELPKVYPNPEPTTMLLVGFGLLGIARISRRKL